MATQRNAREAALKAIYLAECRSISVDEAFVEMEQIDQKMAGNTDDPEIRLLKPFGLGITGERKDFALHLARKAHANRKEYDEKIAAVLKNWDISRVSRIDRIIMWMCLTEMTVMLDIPLRVSINEAVELARRWSSEKSPGFVNGVLDAVARNMGVIKST